MRWMEGGFGSGVRVLRMLVLDLFGDNMLSCFADVANVVLAMRLILF